MIQLRSRREIEAMRMAGQLVREAHRRTADLVRPGITTAELDAVVDATFAEQNAEPLFKGYPGQQGPFPAATCISVNEEVVHGVPGDRALQAGEIVSLDTGCRLDGWCGDAAVTYPVGSISEEAARLLDVTRETLALAISLLDKKSKWSEVAAELQQFVEAANFAVIEQFVGHGIGRELHEEPQVPNFDSPTLRENADFRLRTGLVLAIEPMVATGSKEVRCLEDGWTQVTADGCLSAHFEHTVALTSAGPELLTGESSKPQKTAVP
jgi:methionyl aminopeptidase